MKTTTRTQTAAIAAAALALASTGLPASADTVYYALGVDESSASQSAWGTAGRWVNQADGTTAAYAPNSGNAAVTSMDFIVTNNFALRTVNTTYTNCNGRMTLGTLDSAGNIINKAYGKTVVFKQGLTVVNGIYWAMNQNAAGETSRARIGGRVTIASPESAPFLFGNEKYNAVTILADISGAAGTKFLMGGSMATPTSKPGVVAGSPMILSGDNNAFLGKIEVASDGAIALAIGSGTALGGARESFAADTVKISTTSVGTLLFTNGAPAKIDTANLGFTFNGVQGGTVYPRTFAFDVIEGMDVEFAVPVTAYGQCSNNRKRLTVRKDGAGTLTWSGAFSTPDGIDNGYLKLEVAKGRIILASASTISLTNELSDAVWLKSPGAADTALSRWTFSAGGALLFDATEGKTPGAFVLDANSAISDAALPLPVHVETDTPGADCDVCVLKVPSSVKELSASDFTDATAPAGKAGQFRIATANGVQTVSLVRGSKATVVSFR